jgi:hypothetical protein
MVWMDLRIYFCGIERGRLLAPFERWDQAVAHLRLPRGSVALSHHLLASSCPEVRTELNRMSQCAGRKSKGGEGSSVDDGDSGRVWHQDHDHIDHIDIDIHCLGFAWASFDVHCIACPSGSADQHLVGE